MSVVYNSCNCPASTFSGNNPFSDMDIEAVVGATQTQTLNYQENYMESSYGQYCGSYELLSSPTYAFFSFSQTGTNQDNSGNAYTDLGTLTAGTLDDIGQYTMTMTTQQDLTDSNQGFNTPYRGAIPSVTQTFLLTIHPCSVTSLVNTDVQPDIVYRLSDATITLGTYKMDESPSNCGYDMTMSVQNLPAWASHDDTNREFTVPLTTDQSLIGVYPVTIFGEVQVWDDYTKSSQSTITQ